jgi:hypothetical protein
MVLSLVVGDAAWRLQPSITDCDGRTGAAGATGAGATGVVGAAASRGDADGCDGTGLATGTVLLSATWSAARPVQFATTIPVMSAVAMTSASPIAVNFQGFQLPSLIDSLLRNRC